MILHFKQKLENNMQNGKRSDSIFYQSKWQERENVLSDFSFALLDVGEE
jgi:hypothetical protein